MHRLRLAIVRQRQFGQADATEDVLTDVRRAAETLVPTVDDLRAAVTNRRPVHILESAHWPTGWLYHLDALDPLPDDAVHAAADALLTLSPTAVVHRRLLPHPHRTDGGLPC